MTHELLDILDAYQDYRSKGISCLMVTLVHLEGSSYRKPGVRMLIAEDHSMVGAVSGGCVEKEILRQSLAVFESKTPTVMEYDGRYRLGCEGILKLLIEPLDLDAAAIADIVKAVDTKQPLTWKSHYRLELGAQADLGSEICIGPKAYALSPNPKPRGEAVFEQDLAPLNELFIFGAEHDSAILSQMASTLGFRVQVVAPPDEQKSIDYFKGAYQLMTPLFSEISDLPIGPNAAVVLMTHSISKDTQYLLELTDFRPAYIGLLGPAHRRERLIDALLERKPETDDRFIDLLRGPAGLDLGAQSAPEIALSILSEILSVLRQKDGKSLHQKRGNIHA